MSSSICLRRLSLAPSDISAHTSMTSRSLLAYLCNASFSTSLAQFAQVQQKKKRANLPPERGTKNSVKIKKKSPVRDVGKRPALGERKALRKRIVLSNTNAFEVQGLKDLHATNMHTNGVKGRVMGLPGIVVDSLRAVEAFKTTQGWNLFRRPAILMRKESTQIAEFIHEVEAAEGKKTIRRILIGDRASGKSTLILQALAMAFLKEWVVINLPDGMLDVQLCIRFHKFCPTVMRSL